MLPGLERKSVLEKESFGSKEQDVERGVMTARLGKTRQLGKGLTHEAGPDPSLPYLALDSHIPATIISTWEVWTT